MTSRRYLMAFAVTDGSETKFMNVAADIEGDLETGIKRVKAEIVSNMNEWGVTTELPVLISAIQIDTLRPPEWVELPIMVKRTLQQIVIDYGRGEIPLPEHISDLRNWLDKLKEVNS